MNAVALSSTDDNERAICYAGITYASLIKIYESERRWNNLMPDQEYLPRSERIKIQNDIAGLGGIGISSQDIARNLNADLYVLSMSSDFSGVMLQELIERISTELTVFSRLDTGRLSHSEPNNVKVRRFSYMNHE